MDIGHIYHELSPEINAQTCLVSGQTNIIFKRTKIMKTYNLPCNLPKWYDTGVVDLEPGFPLSLLGDRL